jgi:hypothetical protein
METDLLLDPRRHLILKAWHQAACLGGSKDREADQVRASWPQATISIQFLFKQVLIHVCSTLLNNTYQNILMMSTYNVHFSFENR